MLCVCVCLDVCMHQPCVVKVSISMLSVAVLCVSVCAREEEGRLIWKKSRARACARERQAHGRWSISGFRLRRARSPKERKVD